MDNKIRFELIDNDDGDIIFSNEFENVTKFFNSPLGKTHFGWSRALKSDIRKAIKENKESFDCNKCSKPFDAYPATLHFYQQ